MNPLLGFVLGLASGAVCQWIALNLAGNYRKLSGAENTAANQLLSLIHLALWGIAGILIAIGEKR